MKKPTLKLLSLFALAAGATLTAQAQTTPAPQPSICTRACWGARANTSAHTQMAALSRAIIHHTAGPSDYTTDYETAKARMRGVQNYHMDSNGWSDIGYHFTVSAGGHIFEGRYGSMSALPRGAHDGCNANSFGFTALGYYHTPYNHAFTSTIQNALYNVIAWRMPAGWSSTGTGAYCGVTAYTLDGHRTVKATACPGEIIWAQMGNARSGVSSRRTSIVNNAAVAGISYPSSVIAGQSFTASVTMNNNGTTTWTADATPHNLGSQNPQDNNRWGLGRVGISANVSPGQNHTFTFTCTAPTTPGTYPFDWRMVEDGVQWFGATATGTITVTAGAEVIVDNSTATYVGSWAVGSSSADKYGGDYRYHSTAAISEPAVFTGNISGGTRNVYAWWPAGSNRSASAPYIVYHSAGSTTVHKNQQANGGSWQLLGAWNFNTGNNEVRLSCWTTTGFIVVADAVKWQ